MVGPLSDFRTVWSWDFPTVSNNTTCSSQRVWIFRWSLCSQAHFQSHFVKLHSLRPTTSNLMRKSERGHSRKTKREVPVSCLFWNTAPQSEEHVSSACRVGAGDQCDTVCGQWDGDVLAAAGFHLMTEDCLGLFALTSVPSHSLFSSILALLLQWPIQTDLMCESVYINISSACSKKPLTVSHV